MQSSTALRYRLARTDFCASILILVRYTSGRWSARTEEGLERIARRTCWLLSNIEGAWDRTKSAWSVMLRRSKLAYN
jgi:hypothetical protein